MLAHVLAQELHLAAGVGKLAHNLLQRAAVVAMLGQLPPLHLAHAALVRTGNRIFRAHLQMAGHEVAVPSFFATVRALGQAVDAFIGGVHFHPTPLDSLPTAQPTIGVRGQTLVLHVMVKGSELTVPAASAAPNQKLIDRALFEVHVVANSERLATTDGARDSAALEVVHAVFTEMATAAAHHVRLQQHLQANRTEDIVRRVLDKLVSVVARKRRVRFCHV